MAYALAKQGKKVLAIERDLSQPDKIIGELLQPGGVASLTALGLQDCLEFDEIDSPKILGYAVFPPNGDAVRLPYPKVDGVMPRGRSFHHGRFIQNLRKRTKEVADVKEATVTGLIEEEGRVIGVEWKAKNSRARGKSFADFVFVCDGMFSNFRENFTDQQVSHTSKFFGLVLEDAATDLPFSNHGHVFLLKPTPTLIYPISSTDVRVLVDIPEPCPKSLEDVKEYLRNVTAPQLPEKVRAMFLEAVEKASKVKSMPCGKMHPKPLVKKGAAIVGDSFNVRHPLTGGGMTVALNDVMILNDILGRPEFSFRNDRQVEKAMVEWYSRRKGIASQINILAQALYNVFSNENLRIAVINYLNLGNICRVVLVSSFSFS